MAERDLVRDLPSFSLHVREEDDTFTGYVYLGTEIVFVLSEPTSLTPDGIGDFANVVTKKFARALNAATAT